MTISGMPAFLKQRVTTNSARVHAAELTALLKKNDLYDGSYFLRLELHFMSFVFWCTGELIPAQWAEFDRRAASRLRHSARHHMECPALFVPVKMRHTGTRSAGHSSARTVSHPG